MGFWTFSTIDLVEGAFTNLSSKTSWKNWLSLFLGGISLFLIIDSKAIDFHWMINTMFQILLPYPYHRARKPKTCWNHNQHFPEKQISAAKLKPIKLTQVWKEVYTKRSTWSYLLWHVLYIAILYSSRPQSHSQLFNVKCWNLGVCFGNVFYIILYHRFSGGCLHPS